MPKVRHITLGVAVFGLIGCANYGWADRPRPGDKPLGFERVDVETVRTPPEDRMEADVLTLELVEALERCGRGVRARWAKARSTTTQATLSCQAQTKTQARGTMQTHDVDLVCTIHHGTRHQTLTKRAATRTQWDADQGPSRVGGLGLTSAGREAARRIACPLLRAME